VLDLCAAPGNKTSQLAQSAGRPGRVVACDLHLHRLTVMGSTQKLPNIYLVVLDGAEPLPFRASFDRILVDAPCSGTGTLRRHPEIKWRLTPSGVQALAEKQHRLLTCAAEVLSAGGRMVYSTCSLEDEENRAVVKNFLSLRPDFRLLPLRDDASCLRPLFHPSAGWILEKEFLETSPARDGADGFFAAILLKRKPE
ncbi:MAG: RsmB/NOP family class I SAM-dependent RNA methyltransferase, partial [Acidobacteria bacterium]|nr:RsmB/NOP family class I SAM-dependent RNA methyltransferase [Acidobacteriota bacterium]